MKVWFVLGIAGCSVALVAVLAMLPPSYRYWLGKTSRFDYFDERMDRWPFGVLTWKVFRRSITAVCLLGLPFLISTLTFMIAGGGATPVGGIAESVLFVCAGIGTVGAFSVIVLNRPRLLVPPHLRNEPGLLESIMEDR